MNHKQVSSIEINNKQYGYDILVNIFIVVVTIVVILILLMNPSFISEFFVIVL